MGSSAFKSYADGIRQIELCSQESAVAETESQRLAGMPVGKAKSGNGTKVQLAPFGYIPPDSESGSEGEIEMIVAPVLKSRLSTHGEMAGGESCYGIIEKDTASGVKSPCSPVGYSCEGVGSAQNTKCGFLSRGHIARCKSGHGGGEGDRAKSQNNK